MTHELSILLVSAATLGLVHTLIGPDHYVPFVAMAGMRYSENHWRNTHRSILFARAAEIPTNFSGEDAQGDVREFLEIAADFQRIAGEFQD